MRVLNRWMFVLSGTLLAAACGGATSGDGAKGVPIDDLPELLIGSYCQVLEDCFGPAFSLFLPGEDCVSTFGPSFEDEIPGLKAAIDNGRVRYDGKRVQACVDELAAMGCDLLTTRVSEACEDALDGTVAVGGGCARDEECAGSAYCKFSTMCPGVCTTLEGAGGSCDRDDQCANDLVCDESTNRCVKPGLAGDDCGGGVAPPCRADLLCAGADLASSTAGTCTGIDEVLSAQDGATCNILDTALCAPELHCTLESVDTTTGMLTMVCGAGVSSGAACKPAIPDVCPVDQYCNVAQNSLDGTCTAKPGDGEPCAKPAIGDAATLCAPNLRCDGGVCRARQHLGGTCMEDAVCYSGQCVDGACTATGVCSG